MQICVSVKPNGCEIKWENTSGIDTASEQFEWFFSPNNKQQTTKTQKDEEETISRSEELHKASPDLKSEE